jgi:hypothetical protein
VYTFLLNPILESLLHILHLNIFGPAISRNISCQIINIRARSPLTAGDKRRTVAEEFIHVFEIEPLGFRLETPEEDSVGKVAYDKYDVEFLVVSSQLQIDVEAVEDSPSRLKIWRLELLVRSSC